MTNAIQWGPYTTPIVVREVSDGLSVHRQKFTQKKFNVDSELTIEQFNKLFNEYSQIIRKNVGKSFTAAEVNIREPLQFNALFKTLNCYLVTYNLVLKREGMFYRVESKGSS